MLRSRIIPCLLIRNKGLVKTKNFKDDKYVGDPINAVKIFNEKEVDELSIFDIDATTKNLPPDLEHLRSIAIESRMPLCYGGGVKSASLASKIISIGFEKVSISSAAIERPDLIREMANEVGSQSVVVTVDVKKHSLFSSHTMYTHNGTKKHKTNILDFIQQAETLGAGEIVINSIDRDGMMSGYDINFAKLVREKTSLPLTLVGGAAKTEDMQELIDSVGVVGASAGSMFVFNGPYRAVLISYKRPERLVPIIS